MDIVITYVNGLDPLWQKDYESAVGKSVLEKRFRDWGTLPYLFRAIEKNLPFAGNVYLVVSGESQVPQWVDRDRVKVVLHKDIIPQEYLPVFNSSSIEMFLHRIPGLAKEFLYLNDDFFPMRSCTESTFFEDGHPVTGMKRQLFVAGSDFRYLVRRSDRLSRKAAGLRKSIFYLRPQHICYALLRSCCEQLYKDCEKEILSSVTRVRERSNYNIYLFLDYAFHLGLSVNRKLSKKHFSLAVADPEEIRKFILNPSRDFVCINDVRMSDKKYSELNSCLLESFQKKFPEKSCFEL